MGRMGDIIMALPSVYWLARKKHCGVDLLIHSSFEHLAGFLRQTDCPILDYRFLDYCYEPYDSGVFGSSVAALSDMALEHLYPGYDLYVNANIPFLPPGHVAEYIAFKCGLTPSMSSPIINFGITAHSVPEQENFTVFHLGANCSSRRIGVCRPSYSGRFICIGGPEDPIEEWMEDRRGLTISETANLILRAKTVVGSDSFFTNLSAALGADTICLHKSEVMKILTDRRIYRRGRSIVLEGKDFNLDGLNI